MNKNLRVIIVCIVLSVLIAVTPLIFVKDSEFGGSDGQGEELITEIDSEYKPWFSSIIEPPGGETESLLFCLQAAIGAGAFGFGMGFLVARKKFKENKSNDSNR